MSRVMDKEGIAGLGLRGQGLQGVHDIGRRGFRVLAIVEQGDNVLVGKTVAVLNVVGHVVHVVVATAQFARIVAHVVDANHDGPAGARKALVGNHAKRVVHRGGAAAGQLGNLLKALGLELFSHGKQSLLEAQILARVAVVGVRHVQETRRQGATGTAGRIREPKGTHVGDCRMTKKGGREE